MSHFTALYDACTLYPATTRDLLMWLATTGTFRAKWTAHIHEDLIARLEAREFIETAAFLRRALGSF